MISSASLIAVDHAHIVGKLVHRAEVVGKDERTKVDVSTYCRVSQVDRDRPGEQRIRSFLARVATLSLALEGDGEPE